MAIYDQPKDVDTRVRFFDGQYLIDQDFVDEQKYHLDRERRLGKVLRITGIAEGLAVASSAGQPNKVTIGPGTAIDSDGRQIVLAKERTLDLPATVFNNKSAIKLYIIYRELETENAKVGSEGARRFYENPLIAAVAADGTATDAWDSALTPVLLAQLSVSSNGAVTVDANVSPQYAGLSLRGNVGIGTTSPAARLHVSAGQIQVDGNQKIVFTDTDTSNNLKLQLYSGYGLGINASTLFYAANGNHSWRDNNGANERMLLSTAANGGLTVKGTGASSFAGNLGIGTSSPGDYKLNVNGSTRLGGSDFAAKTVLSVASGTIQFDAPGIPGGRFVINGANGNVGIGTTTPGAKLEVAQSSGLAIKVEPASGKSVFIGRSEENSLQFDASNGQAFNSAASLSFNIDSNSANATTRYIDFRTSSKGFAGGSSLLRILESGRVGVNTTDPGNYQLNVNGSSRLGGATEFGETTVLSVAPGTVQFDAPYNAGGRFVINGATGNVGIGTNAPGAHRLNVQGGSVYCGGDVFVTNLVFYSKAKKGWCSLNGDGNNDRGTAIWEYNPGGPSDIRFKTDVLPIYDALEKVLRLAGVSYRWGETGLEHLTRNVAHQISAGPNATEEENERLWAAEREKARQALAGDNIGLIAQAVESVVPEVVYEDEHGYKHIRYQQLAALLIEAIKEQHALIQALSDKVTALAAV
jgi:hypothetical protein